eukprot:scaffold71553_cov71-Phaeocystis_antarctica.AAC.3
MDMSKTLSDLPTDLHRLILSHDEEKIELKKENEKLKTQVRWLQNLIDEQEMQPSDESDYEEEREEVTEEEIQEEMANWSLPSLRMQLIRVGIKGFSKKNKREVAIRVLEYERYEFNLRKWLQDA